MSNKKDVMVVFTQDGEHIHSWESCLSLLSPLDMLEAACSSGLVDKSRPLDFIVYDDTQADGVEVVLMEGKFKEALLN